MLEIMVHSEGDLGVGIPSCSSNIQIPFEGKQISEGTRKWLREEFERIFGELHDTGRTRVLFSDECDYCGCLISKGKCPSCVLSQV